ncbi:stachyose synthase-like [Typha angustifolia]|uniref:stachyose synthase-like n=1 Tax=Typha angustifolia TaxID=59011 RepID=UPI003C2ED504
MAPNQTFDSKINSTEANGLSNLFSLSDAKLNVGSIPLLTEVPQNVTFTIFSSLFHTSNAPNSLVSQAQSQSHKGGFLGFHSPAPSHRVSNSLGKLAGRSFLSIFRFKTWWTTIWVGNSGSDLQMETQLVMFEVPELGSYVLLLPLIEGGFRSAIYPGVDDHVVICAESGSSQVQLDSFQSIAYVHVSDNPYNLMREAYTAVRVYLNTFRLLEEKSLPPIVDRFGWCTWDASYLTVDPVGVWHGLEDFFEAGLPPRFVIIDDGWQSISLDGESPLEDAKNLVLGGEQMNGRLYTFEECERFRNYKGGSLLQHNLPDFDAMKRKAVLRKAGELEGARKSRKKATQSGVADVSLFEFKISNLKRELDQLLEERAEDHVHTSEFKSDDMGLRAFIEDLRTRFQGLDDVYVWQALCGAWGGVRPGATHLNSKVIPVKVSPGLDGTMEDLAVEKIEEGGIGLVHPDQAVDFYDSMHSYLASAGVTGVKIDVIQTLEYVCEDYGGRVELAKTYYDGLSKSLVKNFNGTGLIASMQQCNDFFYLGTWQVAMARAGDDFWFEDPNGDPMGMYWLQGAHMINCSYNSLWMGQMIQPDWDMFQSDHACAKFHAASRAICGGPVYVSDSPGGHDFDLLRRLVFPDGSIPKCQHFALPTRDCLFKNLLFDQKTILKIWNLNKSGGVIGAFNCQGAGWDPETRRVRGYPHCYKPVSGRVRPADVEWDQKEETSEMGQAEEFAVYLNQAEEVILMTSKEEAIQFTLQPSSFELFTFVPIKKLSGNVKFAPLGLVNMLNCGGAIMEVEYGENGSEVEMEVKGGGKLLVYSNVEPKRSLVNGVEVGMEWSCEGEVKVEIPWVEEQHGVSHVIFAY